MGIPNGDTFNADDVIHNLNRWCDASAKGNSIAGRMGALVDEATKKAVDGGIKRVDNVTVRLNLPKPDISLIPSMVDYPALIVHRSYDGELDPLKGSRSPPDLANCGTSAEVRRKKTPWWKGDFPLEAIQWTDYGSDPNPTFAAFESKFLGPAADGDRDRSMRPALLRP